MLPLLEHIVPHLRSPALQQAADDILARMNEPETAELVADMAIRSTDPVHQRELLAMLARRLAGSGTLPATRPKVLQSSRTPSTNPEMRQQGIALAVATRDGRYRATLEGLAENVKVPEDVRVAAVEALGSFRDSNRVLDQLITSVRGKPSSNSVAEAAVRATSEALRARDQMVKFLTSRDYPLGLRREALRTLAELQDGGSRVIELARVGKLPDDLKNDATTLLHTSHIRQIREAAATVLPLPKTASGQMLPPIRELVRRDGDPEKGRGVFFRAGPTHAAVATAFRGAVSGSVRTSRRLESSMAATS